MADPLTILLSGLLSSAIVFLARTWISERLKNAIRHEYDEKLETHRAQLKAEHETEIERLRADLRVAAHQKEIHLTRLHEETANTIAKTYALLHEVDSTVRAYTKTMETPGDPSKAERREAVSRALKEFDDYFKPRRIWLPLETEKQIDEFVNELHKIAVQFCQEVEQGGSTKSWIEAIKAIINKAEPLRASLESELRRILRGSEVT